MIKPHPDSFQIEIDHQKLCKYLRLQAISGLATFFVFFGAFLGLINFLEHSEITRFASGLGLVVHCLLGTAIGVSIGLAIALSVYFVFYHYPSRRQANAFELSVEGPYLRFREGFLFTRDRKLHFRSIVDYTYYENPLMRWCGIAGISMTTIAGWQNSALRVPAVKDAEKVRDILSEIDRQREDLSP